MSPSSPSSSRSISSREISRVPWVQPLLALECLPEVLLIACEDAFPLYFAGEYLKRKFGRGKEWYTFQAGEISTEELLSRARTPFLFGGGTASSSPSERVCLVRGAQQWNSSEWNRLQGALVFPGSLANTHLIFLWEGNPERGRRNRIPPVLLDLLKKRQQYLPLPTPGSRELSIFLQWYATTFFHRTLPPESAQILLTATGENLFMALNELRKYITTYPDPRTPVEPEKLVQLLGWHEAYNIFQWMEQVAKKNGPAIVAIARYLARNVREFPFFMVGKMTFQLFLYAHLVGTLERDVRKLRSGDLQKRLNLSWWWARLVHLTLQNYTPEEIWYALNILYVLYQKALGVISGFEEPWELTYDLGVWLAHLSTWQTTQTWHRFPPAMLWLHDR